MAPANSMNEKQSLSRSLRSSAARYDTEEETMPQSSQVSQELDVDKAMDNMLQTRRLRREARRDAFMTAHDQRTERIENDIKIILESRQKAGADRHEERKKQLDELLKKKQEMEYQLVKSIHTLQKAYKKHLQELKVTVDGCNEELG